MIFRSYTVLVKKLLYVSQGDTLSRCFLRKLMYRQYFGHGSFKLNSHKGSPVPRKCLLCMNYHNKTGNQSDEDVHEGERNDNVAVTSDEEKETVGKKRVEQNDQLHIPVLKDVVLSCLGGKSRQKFLDMTFGAGGHTKSLLDSGPGCHVFALDRDPFAHRIAMELAEKRPGQVTPLLGRFSELPTLLATERVQAGSLDGVLFDLGCSSMQFDISERGFSLSRDGPLDMRMDADRLPGQPTAADVVNTLDEIDLIKIFKKYGEERRAIKIADAIIDARSAFGRITTTKELADIIDGVSGGAYGCDSLGRYSHPATKIFQALRIFVNNELNELDSGLRVAHKYLRPGGICVAISFHSLEDRIVKRHFRTIDLDMTHGLSVVRRHRLLNSSPDYADETMVIKRWEPVNKRVIVATEEEKRKNPRSRSAKLRVVMKLEISQ